MLDSAIQVNKSLINYFFNKYMAKKGLIYGVAVIIAAGVVVAFAPVALGSCQSHFDSKCASSQSSSQSSQSQTSSSVSKSTSASTSSSSSTASASVSQKTEVDVKVKVDTDHDNDYKDYKKEVHKKVVYVTSYKKLPATGSGLVGLFGVIALAITGTVISIKKLAIK